MTVNLSFIHDHQLAHRVTSIEGESPELVNILNKIVQNASALLEVGNCSIALLDTTGSTLVTLANLPFDGQKLQQARFLVNEGVADWVAKHHTELIINNVEVDERFKDLGSAPVGSIMCVPLMDQNHFMGILTASSQEINAFDERKASMLTIFADQAALVISNARNARLARRQADQLEMLIHLTRGITTHQEPEALYRTILVDVKRLLPCDLARVYRYHEGRQDLCPVAEWSGAVDGERSIRLFDAQEREQARIGLYNDSLVAWASLHRHPMLGKSLDSVADRAVDTPGGLHRAELAAPFVSKEIVYGVLYLQREAPFTSEELRLVRNLGNMVAAALENVQLFQTVRTDHEQLRAILTSSSDGIALLDVNTCFIEANAAFGAIFGIDSQLVIGMTCSALLGCGEQDGPETVSQLALLNQALVERKPLRYSEFDLHIQGAVRSLGVSVTPVSTTGMPLCLLVARDVTVIRDANRVKAKFISMITHELRSPINAINGYLDLALAGVGGELNEQQSEFIRRARSGSEFLFALVEDLLLVSRADAGQLRLNRAVVNIQEIIVDAVEEMELTAADNHIIIIQEISKDVPPLYADAVRLQQIVRNLLSNALRFTPSGGEIVIAVSVEQERARPSHSGSEDETRQMLKLQVRDTGCGIAPEFHTRIFERFYQVPRKGGGHAGGQGLGLAIVKTIVELHGGYITVESAEGQGSIFNCLLPCLSS